MFPGVQNPPIGRRLSWGIIEFIFQLMKQYDDARCPGLTRLLLIIQNHDASAQHFAFLSLRPGRLSPAFSSKISFQWIFQYHRCTPGKSPFHFEDEDLQWIQFLHIGSSHGDTKKRPGGAVDWNKHQWNMWKMWIILTDYPGIYWVYSSYSVINFFINASNCRYIQSNPLAWL